MGRKGRKQRSAESDSIRKALLNPRLRTLPNGKIAELTGTHRTTVGWVRTEMEQAGEIPPVPRKCKTANGATKTMNVQPSSATRYKPVKRCSDTSRRSRDFWDGMACCAGIDADELHGLAAEKLSSDRQHRRALRKLLSEARAVARSSGADWRTLNLRVARGADDASVRALDVIARTMRDRYPEFFTGRQSDEERLFDLLSAGVPTPLDRDDAYRSAFDHLRGQVDTSFNFGTFADEDDRLAA